MSEGVIDEFIVKLAAEIEGCAGAEAYKHRQQLMLDSLDRFKTVGPLRDEGDYELARAIKSALCSLSCYTSNTGHEKDDEVWALESVWGKALAHYNKRFLLKDQEDVALANYLLCKRRYSGFEHMRMLLAARDRGILRRRGTTVFVVGLEKKVGDNVFRMDRLNRHHRQFGRTIGRQAFPVAVWRGDTFMKDEAFMGSLPELGKQYVVTDLGDGKNCARYPAMKSGNAALLYKIHERAQSPAS